MCGGAKLIPAHVGTPQSLNAFGYGNLSRFEYNRHKQLWEQVLTEQMHAGLPRVRFGRVMVEGRCCFPDRTRRDQGNYRFLVEKALGDALTAGGWLEDDDWSRYEFGNLAYLYSKGESWTELILFPAPARDEEAPEVGWI